MFKGGFSKIEKGCGLGEELDGLVVSYTLKIIERSRSIYFFRNILGMRVICHREYEQGNNLRNDLNINNDSCWSSTVLSYGKEHNYLNLELIYIYNKKSYLPGNIFKGMTIRCSRCLKRALTLGWPVLPGNVLQSPGGYVFYILDEPQPIRTDPIVKISLGVADLKASKAFYNGLIGFRFCENYYQASNPNIAILGLQQFDAKLELTQNEAVNKGENTGMLGVGAEYNEQIALEERFINKSKANIIIPLIPMDTPDKATMAIFKVQDPDGHEIVFYEFTPYQNVFQYSPEDESRMVKLFEDDEIPEDNKNWNNSKKSFGKKSSKAGVSKEDSGEKVKSKIKEITRSLGSIRPQFKSKESKEENSEPEDIKNGNNPNKSSENKSSKSRISREASCEVIKSKIKEITRSLGSIRPQFKSKESKEELEGNDEVEDGGIEDNKNANNTKKSSGKKSSKSRISKEASCEAIKTKIKEITRSLGSIRPQFKSKESNEELEENNEPEAGGSSKVEKCPTIMFKGISRSLGSIKDFGKSLRSRSDIIWCKECKDRQDKPTLNTDEPNPLGDKTINRSEQINQEEESNAQGSVATQEPVAIEVQASAKIEAKKNRGVSNEANKSAQHTGFRIKKTSRGTNSEQRLVDSTTEDDPNPKTFKSTFTCANNPFKEDMKCINIKCSMEDTKNVVKENIKNLLKKTSSLIQRCNNEPKEKSTEDMMVDGHLYFNAKFEVIPPHKVPSFAKSETSRTSGAGRSPNQEMEQEKEL